MTKFKCKISDLETIARLVSAKGKNIDGKEYQAIPDCLIDASNGKLTVKAMDTQHTFGVKVEYKNVNVEEPGLLPIGNLSTFTDFLGRFLRDDEVSVYTSENRIVIERENPKKIAKYPLASPDTISSMPTPPIDNLKYSKSGYPMTPKLPFNLKVVIDSEEIASIFEDGDVIKERILPVKVENGKLKMTVNSEVHGEFSTELTPESVAVDEEYPAEPKTESYFGNGFNNIFANLNGKVSVYLGAVTTSTPLCVEQETEKFKYTAILAPYARQ